MSRKPVGTTPGASTGVQAGVDVGEAFAGGLHEARFQRCPQGRYRAGSTNDGVCPVDAHLITRCRVGVPRDIGYSATGSAAAAPGNTRLWPGRGNTERMLPHPVNTATPPAITLIAGRHGDNGQWSWS